jgi:predicted secreted Zn-dependent protease
MAAYNSRNFNLGQFMNDLFQQSDLSAQFQFLENHLQVVNAYASAMEQELTQVTAVATAAQAQVQAQPGTL